MAQRRAVTITIEIGEAEAPEISDSRREEQQESTPPGFSTILRRLRRGRENPDYAREHAARIWNNAHPEEPVATSTDGSPSASKREDESSSPNLPNFAPAKRRAIMSSGRPVEPPRSSVRRRKGTK